MPCVLPGFCDHMGDAAPGLIDSCAGVDVNRAARTEIGYRDVDRARQTKARIGEGDLGHCRHLQQGRGRTAMQGGQHGIADQFVGERHDDGHFVAVRLGSEVQEARIRQAVEQGGGHAAVFGFRLAPVRCSPSALTI
ncbi:hypothetical protein D3C73_1174300 [compost metagenome]